VKIALVRIIRQFFNEGEEWVKDHMTDFSEVSQKEYNVLREFVDAHNRKHKADRQYIIVEDETHLLPKTIAAALEYAETQKRKAAEEEKRLDKIAKERIKLKKKREVERMAAEVAKLEEYKDKLDKMKRRK